MSFKQKDNFFRFAYKILHRNKKLLQKNQVSTSQKLAETIREAKKVYRSEERSRKHKIYWLIASMIFGFIMGLFVSIESVMFFHGPTVTTLGTMVASICYIAVGCGMAWAAAETTAAQIRFYSEERNELLAELKSEILLLSREKTRLKNELTHTNRQIDSVKFSLTEAIACEWANSGAQL